MNYVRLWLNTQKSLRDCCTLILTEMWSGSWRSCGACGPVATLCRQDEGSHWEKKEAGSAFILTMTGGPTTPQSTATVPQIWIIFRLNLGRVTYLRSTQLSLSCLLTRPASSCQASFIRAELHSSIRSQQNAQPLWCLHVAGESIHLTYDQYPVNSISMCIAPPEK